MSKPTIVIAKTDVESGTVLSGSGDEEFMLDITNPAMEVSRSGKSLDNVLAAMDKMILENDVIMFSKKTCPFCFGLKRTLISYGVSFVVFEVDGPNMARHQQVLKDKTGSSTVPSLFVKKKSLGGCTDIKALEHKGELLSQLGPYITRTPDRTEQAEVGANSLFWFPDTVDANVARLASLLSCIYSILCVALYWKKTTKWFVLGLACDYFLRLVFGANYSVGGALAGTILARVAPRFAAGPPKQFAAFCGLFMSSFAAALMLSGEPVGGAVVLAGLVGASGLEGVLDFCLGCWMFGYAIAFGLVPASVYAPYLQLSMGKKWGYAYSTAKRNLPFVSNTHVMLPGQKTETPVDLIRKDRLESEYKLEDVDVIRHTRVDFFVLPMTSAALGVAFIEANSVGWETSQVYKALGVLALIMFILVAVPYTLRAVLYPRKALKEWRNPIVGNFFSAIPISITLGGIIFLPTSADGGLYLTWIGALLQMAIAVVRISDLVYLPITEETLNPSLLMAPVGCFASALAFVQYTTYSSHGNLEGSINLLFVARLWFAVAAFFGLVLFTITFRKAMLDHHSDVRVRPTLWVWLAATSISGPAYAATSGGDVTRGLLFQSLWCISFFLFMVNGLGLFRGFYKYTPDLAVWIMPFATSAFATSTLYYYHALAEGRDTMFVMCVIAISAACALSAVCFCHTLTWALDCSLFTPRAKWGPLSQIKLTHECFRHAIPILTQQALALNPADPALRLFAAELGALLLTFMEHSRHEELLLFPRVRRLFPGMNMEADAEHHRMHAQVQELQQALDAYAVGAGEGGALLGVVQRVLPVWGPEVEAHLRSEEASITVVARKYIPVEEQRIIVRELYELTSGESWHIIMPFVLRNLPSPAWQVRYLSAFVWAIPSRAQEVGLTVYPHLDSVLWGMLADELPAIVPRGARSHRRSY